MVLGIVKGEDLPNPISSANMPPSNSSGFVSVSSPVIMCR